MGDLGNFSEGTMKEDKFVAILFALAGMLVVVGSIMYAWSWHWSIGLIIAVWWSVSLEELSEII